MYRDLTFNLDTSADLLPCPFCGHEAGYRLSPYEANRMRVECSNGGCAVQTQYAYPTREAAAQAWNRRAPGAEVQK